MKLIFGLKILSFKLKLLSLRILTRERQESTAYRLVQAGSSVEQPKNWLPNDEEALKPLKLNAVLWPALCKWPLRPDAMEESRLSVGYEMANYHLPIR